MKIATSEELPFSSKRSLPQRVTSYVLLSALCWKNLLLKRRYPKQFLIEILLPLLFIVIFTLLKGQVPSSVVPAGWSMDSTSDHLSAFATYGTELPMRSLFNLMDTKAIAESTDFLSFNSSQKAYCRSKLLQEGYVSLDSMSDYYIAKACNDAVIPFKIAIAPDTPYTRKYFYPTIQQWYPRLNVSMSTVKILPSIEDYIVFYADEKALMTYIKSSKYGSDLQNPKIYAGIVFDTLPSPGDFGSVEYTLRLNATGRRRATGDVPETNGEVRFYDGSQRAIKTTEIESYQRSGFVTLQTLVNRFLNCLPTYQNDVTNGNCQYNVSNETVLSLLPLIKPIVAQEVAYTQKDNLTNLSAETMMQLLKPYALIPQSPLNVFPTPADTYIDAPFYTAVQGTFGLAFVLSYLYSVSRITSALVLEKETKMRELTKMLGVSERFIIGSWYIVYFLILLVSALLQSLVSVAKLFPNSNFLVIFIFFTLFGTNVIAYSFFISSFFSKAKLGSFISLMLFAVMYVVTFAFDAATAAGTKAFLSILPPVALSMGVTNLAIVEKTSLGMQWDNISQEYENYKFGTALGFMIFNFFFYTILGIYFEQVIPKDYGVAEKWYFPFLWIKEKFMPPNAKQSKVTEASPLQSPTEAKNIEPPSKELLEQDAQRKSCVIRHLRKVFKSNGAEKVAVEDLNLSIYRDQITCLLGHNGAGKTTTISMLTGMIPITSGEAYVGKLSVLTDMDEIRQSLGVCPQHDVLYPDLTVFEHLCFFGRIKGLKGDALIQSVESHIKQVGLVPRRNHQVSQLSGGMKRKLSIAIAYIGQNQFVLLDEPTSGMDPYSRRSTWELLSKNRPGRITILTTHFMDEADLLGDRTAIMASGNLQCCGSSMFLKKIYGVGYQITCIKKEDVPHQNLTNLLRKYVPDTSLLTNAGVEISFQLPLKSSSQFPSMLAELEKNMDAFGLETYGISVTTLEEVFIKAANPLHQTKRVNADAQNTADVDMLSVSAREIANPFFTHFAALFRKRWLNGYRDKRALILSIALPLVLMIFGFWMLKNVGAFSSSPNLKLLTSPLPSNPHISMYCSGVACTSIKDAYTDSIVNSVSSETFGDPPYTSPVATVFGVPYDFAGADMGYMYPVRMGEMCYNYGYGHNGFPIQRNQFAGYLLNATGDALTYNLFVNTTVSHGLPIYKNLMDQSIYRYLAKTYKNIDTKTATLRVNNHPLPHTAKSQAVFDSVKSLSSVTTILLAFAFFPGAVIGFIVKEKNPLQNAKFQQYVSGVDPFVYWLSSYLFDVAVYGITFITTLILMQAFELSTFTGIGTCATCSESPFGAVALAFGVYGFATVPLIYIISTFFREASTAQNMAILIYFLIGMILFIVSVILDLIESTTDLNKHLKFVWRLSPLYCLGSGLLNLGLKDITANMDPKSVTYSAFNLDVYGWEIIYLFVEAIVFPLILIGFDIYGPQQLWFMFMRSIRNKHPESTNETSLLSSVDGDVLAEERRIMTSATSQDIIVLRQLRKVYPGAKKAAVEGLTFGLRQGECFGFLGTNGAGKTTTMSMLTGNVLPSSGSAELSKYDIVKDQLKIRRLMGYCPQFDALIDLMTVREHLVMFGTLKGIPPTELPIAVNSLLNRMGLLEFENKLTQSLSGGNKRKLSVAIAVIGAPKIIFLDEPSTGMDPISRRFMWEILADISTRQQKSTLVLTTHSMEECEALCSRVGIMVNGILRCLGSIQHLKSTFGDGLLTEIRFALPTNDELLAFQEQTLSRSRFATSHTLSKVDIEELCIALGDATRKDYIFTMNPRGYAISQALENYGSVELSSFLSWWMVQDRLKRFDAYATQAFLAAELIEVHNEKVRYKLRTSLRNNEQQSMTLSQVFEKIEQSKDLYHISEYSVSQTTLEQIFNQFASEQINEENPQMKTIIPQIVHSNKSTSPVIPILETKEGEFIEMRTPTTK